MLFHNIIRDNTVVEGNSDSFQFHSIGTRVFFERRIKDIYATIYSDAALRVHGNMTFTREKINCNINFTVFILRRAQSAEKFL